MNTNHKLLAAVIAVIAQSPNVMAFERETHAAMTSEAIKQSKITGSPNTSPILKKLGLYDKDEVLKKRYIDIGSSLTSRDGAAFEDNKMRDVKFKGAIADIPNPYSIPGWILRGSIREDDNTEETKAGNNTGSGDEPGGVFNRVYGHFYDPQNDRALTVAGFSVGAKSTDWATDENATVQGRQNRYNIPSAREAMWRALTLKTRIFNDPPLTNGSNVALDSIAAQKEDERNAYWATMFRSIGDVVHLLQDAAQPQHTRNDTHSGLGCVPGTDTCAFGHASFFENYVAARTLQSGQFSLEEGLTSTKPGKVIFVTAPQLKYDGYTPPTFTHFSDYFSTDTGGGNASGKGLANYSNRGFFSFGTNIGNTSYPLPNASALTYSDITGPNVKDMSGNVVGGGLATITFRNGSVTDTVSGVTEPNVKLSTEGVWDQFLIQRGQAPRYTLNYYNYDDQARLLIPRAVGYSAGLIDYFFRGELEISLPDEGVYAVVDYSKESTKDTGGFNKVKLKLRNKTPRIEPSGGGAGVDQNLETSGTVVAVVKFRRNKCYIENTLQGEIPVRRKEGSTVQQIFDDCRDKVEEIVVSDPVTLPRVLAYTDADPVPLTFNFKDRIPINVMDLVLQVVYRGKLGDETDAVVVTTKDVSEPTFFKLTDYFLMSVLPGTCTFQDAAGVDTKSPISLALTESATTPSYLVKAELNGKDYAMFAAISDLGPIKGRGVASWNGGGEMILSSITSTMRFEAEFQPGPTLNSYVTPTYRQSQFYPTAPNTLTLMNDTPPKLTKIRGVFADTGFFLDNNLDYKSCGANPNANYLPTEGHSLMPPHSPLVPKALKELNF